MIAVFLSLFIAAVPDASTSSEAIRTFPGVAKAEVAVNVDQPKHRIIQVRDIADEEIDEAYQADTSIVAEKSGFQFSLWSYANCG